MEDRYDIRVDVGEGKDWWHIHGLSTHDKVYELNRQMCDLERGLSNDFSDMQVRIADKLAKGVVEGVKTPDWAKNMLAGIPEQLSRAEYEILDEILKEKNRPMKEKKTKKTKKMTKAEAFEWLKGKKIKCICAVAYEDAQANKVERFLKDVGCKYHFANHISWRDWYWPLYGFIVDKKGEIYVAFEDQMDFFEQNFNEPISADDILSIEILEDKNNEFVDCSEPCPEIKAVQELLRNSKHLKDKIIVITKDNAAIL